MNERIDDLIALAALGELTDDESRELDHAVQSDPEVAAELAAALEAAAAVQSGRCRARAARCRSGAIWPIF